MADSRASCNDHEERGEVAVAAPSDWGSFVVAEVIEILVGCLSAHNSHLSYQRFGSLAAAAAAAADPGNRA